VGVTPDETSEEDVEERAREGKRGDQPEGGGHRVNLAKGSGGVKKAYRAV
jgi:hypothetical protein